MAVDIPENYPAGCTDTELSELVDKLMEEQVTWGGTQGNRTIKAGDSRLSSLINVGQLQLQKRLIESTADTSRRLHKEMKALKQITDDYSKSSQRFARYSTWLSVSALFVAMIAVVVTLIIATRTSRSMSQWQSTQKKILTQIEKDSANNQIQNQQLQALKKIEQNISK